MANFTFLNNSLNDFLLAIQGTWSSTIQIYGVKILLMLLVISLGINWIYAISQRDAGRLLDSTVYSLVSAGVLYTIFLNAQTFGAAVLNTFIQIGQATSGLSPEALTPSGIVQSGLNLALIFWKRGRPRQLVGKPDERDRDLYLQPRRDALVLRGGDHLSPDAD